MSADVELLAESPGDLGEPVMRLVTDHAIGALATCHLGPVPISLHSEFLDLLVRFDQYEADEAPVDLGVVFRHRPQPVRPGMRPAGLVEIGGEGSWQGKRSNLSSYVARLPVAGPFVEISIFNREARDRVVTVWAYQVE